MNAIEKAIEVLQCCLDHPGADDAIAGLRAEIAAAQPAPASSAEIDGFKTPESGGIEAVQTTSQEYWSKRAKELETVFQDAPFVQAQGCLSGVSAPQPAPSHSVDAHNRMLRQQLEAEWVAVQALKQAFQNQPAQPAEPVADVDALIAHVQTACRQAIDPGDWSPEVSVDLAKKILEVLAVTQQPAEPVANCWKTSQGWFHNFSQMKDAAASQAACERMNQQFCLLYTAPAQREPLTDEQERKAFEQVARAEGCILFARVGDGYADRRTLRCWRVWQAARKIGGKP